MKALLKSATAIAATWLIVGSAQAADWELLPTPTSWLPWQQVVFLPLFPAGENSFLGTETDSSWIYVDVHQTREKDGKLYKAIQVPRDLDVEATAPVGQYLMGGATNASWPPGGGVDCTAFMRACRVVSVEVDGTVIPIDMDTYLHPFQMDMSFFGMASGIYWDAAGYEVYVKFNTTGKHTYKVTFRQVEEFFYVEPYALEGMVDPSPEFEGRRVIVGEQVGNPVDGNMVYSYTLTVVEKPTAVSEGTWGRIKATFQE